MSNEFSHVRKPSVAYWMSALCCGLGQIYCGRVGRGLIMYCISMMFWPIIAIIVFLGDFRFVMISLGGLLLAGIGYCLWSARDAQAIARSMAAIEYEPQEYNRPIVYWLTIFTLVPYAIGLALFLQANTFSAFYLPTASMSPSLVPGDRVLANKLRIETMSFSRGDLIVFRNPGGRKQNYIKRIVALAGDTIEVREGQLLVNGQPLEREMIPVADQTQAMKVEGKQAYSEINGDRRYTILVDDGKGKKGNEMSIEKQTVPIGFYFVLGDNRSLSRDSREFGAIPHADIVGHVLVNFWPGDSWNRFGKIR
jgi:signal peptidase I